MDHHLQTTILGQQRARKNAQDEALLLYNRVRQLQKEEEKAQKRIVETKKKAKEIIKLRERNELKLQEKYERAKEQAELLEQQKIENLKSKEEQLRNRIDQENKILTEKLSVVQQTKEERAEIERLLAESRLLSRKEALEQKEVIRKQQEDARRKIETLKLSKLKDAQDDYERRLNEEIDAKRAKELEIERLAQMELELIERLKAKQAEQRKAYQQLEAVLALGNMSTSKGLSKPGASGTASPAPRSPAPGTHRASSSTGPHANGHASHSASLQSPPLHTPPQEQQQYDGTEEGEPSEEDVARAFSMYDTEGVGEIIALELQGLMQDLGVPLNALQLSQAIAQLDTAQTGRISFGEFLLWWKG